MSPDKIRFQCPHCGKHVRCSVEAAGKRAKCPNVECGAELVVPTPHVEEPAAAAPSVPPTGSESYDLLDDIPPPPPPSANPYQSPSPLPMESTAGPAGPTPAKVKAPGIALIVVGVLDGLYAILNAFSNLFSDEGNAEPVPPEFQDNEFMREFWEGMNQPDPVIGVGFSILMGIAAVVIALGGVSMIRASSYSLAITASVLSMLPCITCLGCCGVGQIVGIWSLIVLLSADGQSYFR